MIDLESVFERNDDEYLKFDRVQKKLNGRPDLHAFLLLDSLLPGNRDMVCAAAHDEIFLDVDVEKLAEVACESDIVDLIRCGVMLDDGGLAMFA